MKRMVFRLYIPLLLVLLISLVAPLKVSAHASLERSDPADNAILETPPRQILLWFSETISAEFSSAQVLDLSGQPVELVNLEIKPAERLMILQLPELESGVYSVLWKVLSTSDGHFTQGLVVFGVGANADLGQAVVVETDTAVPPPEVILRWINFTLLLSLIGAIVIAYLILRPETADPALKSALVTARHRALRWAAWVSGLAWLLNFAWLGWQSFSLLSALPDGASWAVAAWQYLSQTRLGALWWARQALLPLVAGSLFLMTGNKQRKPDWIKSILPMLLVGLLFTQSLTSHAAALTENTTLAIVADTLHLLAASCWVGGLLGLAVGLLPLLRRQRKQFTALVKTSWGAFGRLAALSVVVLVATGLYGTGRQIVSPDAMLTTLYGRTLLVKIGLMLMVGLFGLLNSLLLHPRLAAPMAHLLHRPAGWTPLPLQALPRLVVAEGSLGLAVLLLTGLITAAPTARGAAFTANDDAPAALSRQVDDMLISLTIKPNKPGANVFNIRAVSTRRPPPAEVMRVILRLTYEEQDLGLVSVDAEEVEPGVYRVGGNQLNVAGPWQIDVVVRRRGLEDATAQFDWRVASPNVGDDVILSNEPWETTLTLAASLLILMVLAITAVIYTRQTILRVDPNIIPHSAPAESSPENLTA